MSTILGFAILVGIPGLIGLALPGLLRRIAGGAAAVIAVLLWARGLNIHGYSILFFFLCTCVAIGALLRECAGLMARLIRRPGNGSIPRKAH